MRRDFFRGEIPRHIANRNLVLVESELHSLPALVLKSKLSMNQVVIARSEATKQSIGDEASWIASLRSQ